MTQNPETTTPSDQNPAETQPNANAATRGTVTDQTQNQQQGNSEQFRTNQGLTPPQPTETRVNTEGSDERGHSDDSADKTEDTYTETDAHVGSAQGGS